MPTATLRPTKIDHFSYSQYTGMLWCSKGHELSRLAKAPQIPAWWFIGGRLVHEVTEAYDRLAETNPGVRFDSVRETQTRLDELVEEEKLKKGLSSTEGWLAAGRWPKKSGYDWWRENAPLMVERFIEWRRLTGWEVAYFNGVPGIECDLGVRFDFGELRGAPDRVYRLPSGQLVVADVKSGTSAPKEPLQLGTYANDLEMLGYERPAYGTYVMVKAEKQPIHTELIPLDKYTTPYLEQIYGSVVKTIELGAFVPNVGDACRTCVVQKACYAAGGEDSQRYDRLNPNYVGSLN